MRVRRLLMCLLALLVADRAMAQCRVEGVVRTLTGVPIAGAAVVLEAPGARVHLTATTDAEGRYAFDDVKAGVRVRLVASHAGRPVAKGFGLITLRVETIDLREQPALATNPDDVRAAGSPAGTIGGIVRSAAGAPVVGARVRINETPLTAVTDSAGRYALGQLRAGTPITLHASASGYGDASADVVIPNGSRLDSDFVLEPAPRPSGPGATLAVLEIGAEPERIAARPEEVAGVPSLGANDVARALQFLPGVAATFEAPGSLYVRGGTPGDTLVSRDGYTLYQFDHALGALAPVNMDAVGQAVFARSSVVAGDGGRQSGALRIEGPSAAGRTPGGSVSASALGLAGSVSIPFGTRGAAFVAGRHSPTGTLYNDVLDLFAPGGNNVSARDRAVRYSGGVFDSPPDSSFFDVDGRVEFALGGRDRLSVSVSAGHDRVNASRDVPVWQSSGVVNPEETVALPSDAVIQVGDIRDWEARGLGASWTRRWSPAASTSVSFGRSTFSARNDRASYLTAPSTGQDYAFVAGRGGSAGLTESNDITDTTIRVTHTQAVGFGHVISGGAEIGSLDVAYTSRGEVFRTSASGRYSTSLAPFAAHATSGVVAAAFAQDAWRPTARLRVSPGVRFVSVGPADMTYVEPRVAAAFQLTSQLILEGGWSLDHQAVHRIVREDLSYGDGAFWALSDGATVPVARAELASAGARFVLPGLVASVEGYYRTMEGQTLFAPRLFPGTAPAAGDTLWHEGTGTARGVEALVQHQLGRNTLWAAYTVSRTEYTYPTLERAAFPASHDQRHELKVTDTARIAARWTVSGAWVLASGRPYTPAESVGPLWFPSGASASLLTFGAKNGARLPMYHRLDLSSQRDFVLRGVTATLGGTVFNVFDRQNVWFREYHVVADTVTVNDVMLMGRAVNLFLRIRF